MAYIGNTPAELVTELDNGVVTTAKLADDAVTAAKIIDGTIISDDLNDGIITNAKVSASAAIAASKLAISGGSNITLQSDGTFDLNNTVDVTGGFNISGTAVIDGDERAYFTRAWVFDDNDADTIIKLRNHGTNAATRAIFAMSWSDGTTTNEWLNIRGQYGSKDVNIVGRSGANLKLTTDSNKAVDITAGALQIGGTTVIDSSRAALNLTRVAINNDNSGDYYAGASDLVIGDDNNNDNGITIVTASNKYGRIHFADGTTGADEYAGFIVYKHADDELLMGAGADGGTDLSVGNGYINVAGNLQIGGTTVVDSSRNYTGPYFASSSSVNASGEGGLQMYTNRRLGFDESGVRSWNLKATGGSLAVTSGDGNGALNIAGPELKMGGTTVLEQDRDLVNIRSFSIVGDATSGGEKNKFAQPGTGGSSYSIMTTNNNNGSLLGGKFAILDDNVSGNNAAQARFVINSSGQIGIGQAAPAERLHVGNGNSSFIRVHNAASGDISSGLSVTRGADVGFQLYDNPQDDTTTFNAAGNMNFRKHGVGTRFYLDTDGSVGIGTNNPQRINTFGGTQHAFQITGSTVAEMRLTSSTSGQGDFAIYATNSGKTTYLVNNTSGPTVFHNNGASGQKTLVMDSANRMYSEQTGWMGPIFTWWIASQSGTNDQVSISTSGGVMNLRSYGVGRGSTRGSYNALFHGGFFQKSSLEGALTSGWTEARIWVYGHPANSSHDYRTVDLDIVKWHYSTNWQSTALATIDSSIDPDRGGRLLCSTWALEITIQPTLLK
jgi:hypothetical protein